MMLDDKIPLSCYYYSKREQQKANFLGNVSSIFAQHFKEHISRFISSSLFPLMCNFVAALLVKGEKLWRELFFHPSPRRDENLETLEREAVLLFHQKISKLHFEVIRLAPRSSCSLMCQEQILEKNFASAFAAKVRKFFVSSSTLQRASLRKRIRVFRFSSVIICGDGMRVTSQLERTLKSSLQSRITLHVDVLPIHSTSLSPPPPMR